MKKVFPGARDQWSLALLAVGSTALAACHSNTATYRPAPRYTTSPPTTTAPAPYRCGAVTYPTTPPPNYGQPAYGQPTYPQPGYGQPTYTPPPSTTTTPPPHPPPRGGQMSCGKGKCG
jgi:hypothetical protein